MWHIILITAFPFIIGGVIKPLETLDEAIWKNKLAQVILSVEDNTPNDKKTVFHNPFVIEDDTEGKTYSKLFFFT